MQLGKLEQIQDLRTVWPNEAYDFTPWLAANLDQLNETLNMNLELIQTESSVGGFSLDIFAEDIDSNEKVVIENQLEQTDHDHLGKLITYAAGKSAKKIIWIVKTARDEHKAAIEWLNAHTDDDVQFFLLEVQLWSIDHSAPAVKFEIIEEPNNWSKIVKGNNSSGITTAGEQLKYNYWSAFNDYAWNLDNEFTKRFKKKKASSDHWYTLSIGTSKASIDLLINTVKSIITMEFCINSGDNKDKTLYDKISQHKDDIEKSIGSVLDWRRLDDKKVSRILLEKKMDIKNEDEWKSCFDWYMEYSVLFQDTFSKYL